jgi:hypothetical protein
MKGYTVAMSQSVEHSAVSGFCSEQAENMEMKKSFLLTTQKLAS